MVSFASAPTPPSTTPVVNNDWLISPQIQLASSGNVVTFWAKSCDVTYGLERFKVGVSTTGTAPENFTIISPGAYITTPSNATWVQYSYTLDAYNGQSVYIGINCVSPDQYGFAVDDFKVTTTSMATNDFFKANLSIYPNPADNELNISATNGVTITSASITDVNGRIVVSQKVAGIAQTKIDVTNLTAGVYFVSIESPDGKGTAKFVKK